MVQARPVHTATDQASLRASASACASHSTAQRKSLHERPACRSAGYRAEASKVGKRARPAGTSNAAARRPTVFIMVRCEDRILTLQLAGPTSSSHLPWRRLSSRRRKVLTKCKSERSSVGSRRGNGPLSSKSESFCK